MAAAITSVCLPTTSRANDAASNTGNELIEFCNDNNNKANNKSWAVCLAYVDGVTDGFDLEYSLWLSTDTKVPSEYCPPANATHQQYALMISKYLHDHPESLNYSSSVLVMLAVETAWPCPKVNK